MTDALPRAPEPLTERERAIVPLLIQDCSVEQVAAVLSCAPDVVEELRVSIHRKLGLPDRAALAEWAVREGVV